MAVKFLVSNLGIMFYVLFVYSLLVKYIKQDNKSKVILGVLWALAVWAAMFNHYAIKPGVVFDCRSIILVLSGMFGGPLTVSLPTIVAVACRCYIGGDGLVPGIVVILTSSASGLVYYWWSIKNDGKCKVRHLYITALVAHVLYFLAPMFLLPKEIVPTVAKDIFIPILGIYPIGTVFFAIFMLRQDQLLKNELGLIETNLELDSSRQQLVASNQQLLASNQQLAASEQHLRDTQDELADLARLPLENPSGVFKADLEGNIMFYNSASEVVLIDWEAFDDKKISGFWLNKLVSTYNSSSILTEEISIGNKTYSLIMCPIEGRNYVNCYSVDITERVNAQTMLADSEEKYRELVENVNNVIIRWDSKGIITFANSYTLELFGYQREELIGKSVFETIVPDKELSGRELDSLMNDILTEPKKYESFENENICKDGTRLWMRWTNQVILDEAGKIAEVLAVGTDCTDKKRVEEFNKNYSRDLEEKVKQRTSELFEKNTQLEKEIEERIVAERTLKEAQSKLIQSEKMVSIGRLAAGIAHELNTPLGAIGSTNTTLIENFKKHVKRCDCIYKSYFKYSDVIESFIETIIDNNPCVISSREKRAIKSSLETTLNELGIDQAREVAGFLVESGVHDDYGKYLDIFKSDQTHEIVTYMNDITNMVQGLHVIDSAVKQSSRIAFALREYARESEIKEPELTVLQNTIETALILYGNKIKHGIELNLNFDEVQDIMAFPNQLIQVWSNLIHNAIQAMNEHGTLTISLSQKGNDIFVKFKDTGCGIPIEIQSDIFEPLFTTKPVGLGTGLGLDISKRIVTRHYGTIAVRSEPGETEFTVILPASAPD